MGVVFITGGQTQDCIEDGRIIRPSIRRARLKGYLCEPRPASSSNDHISLKKLLKGTITQFYYIHCPFMPPNETTGEAAGIYVLD